MPFVQRIIEPKFLSRTSLFNTDGKARVTDDELIAVTNNTLANALRQLASLVLVANDIFVELTKELQTVTQRTAALKNQIESLDEVFTFDPKKVTVPVSDICTFSLIKNHYESKHGFDTNLFNASSRSIAVQALYDASTKTPVSIIRQMDRLRQDGHRSSRFFACTPVLGAKLKGIKKKVNLDIESRMPAAVEQLRRWTSAEALGDITIAPDCSNRVAPNISISDDNITNGSSVFRDEGVDHQLPSPQEQVHVIALKFPAEIVAIDVTGKYFNRMSIQRRSFLHKDILNRTDGVDVTVGSKMKQRKPRSRRRNTLAGTDQKEIETAIIAGEEPSLAVNDEYVLRSKSSDLLRSSFKKEDSVENRRSHFYSLKQWGKERFRIMNKLPGSSHKKGIIDNDEVDLNLYEKVNCKRKKNINKDKRISHDNKLSHTSLEKCSEGNNRILIPLLGKTTPSVKLRESSIQRRHRRSGNFKDEPHSSSGNWSASSESGRTSIDSETTHPKSTSNATSANSLNVPNSVTSRGKFNINTSRSNSITSEETITPDIIHDFPEDGETSSIYSCDTEGYYTSFHMDSGLKTLKEEDAPVTPLHSTTAFSSNTIINAENEYELFGKGSTSTTASSAGTVCTTLQASASNRSLLSAPEVPERKSSLPKISHKDNFCDSSLENDFIRDKTGTVKRSPANNKSIVTTLIHQHSRGDMSPDSGHNTSSSPIESTNSPSGIRSCSEFEFSECSDMEGSDRIERIRVKTTINSSRIPSMCVITPPHSDDESVTGKKNILKNNFVEVIQDTSDKDWKNNNQLHILSKPIETNLDNLEYFNLTNMEPTTTQDHSAIVPLNSISDYLTTESIDNYNQDVQNANIRSALSVAELPPSINSISNTKKIQVHTHSILKATLLPYNNVLGQVKLKYQDIPKEQIDVKHTNNFPDDFGDYVTITDVKNNNQKMLSHICTTFETNFKEEYVSLNELPRGNIQNLENSTDTYNSLERTRRQGARVTLNAEGKVVYTSDSLKRRKGAHSTFEPGPYRKETTIPSHIPFNKIPKIMESLNHCTDKKLTKNDLPSRSSSPQLEKLIIRATSGVTSPIAEKVRVPPSTIVTPSTRPVPPNSNHILCGAYVHMQDARVYTDSSYQKEKVHSPSEHPNVCKSLKMQSHANEDTYLTTNVVRNNTQKSSTLSTKQLQPVSNSNFETLTISDNSIFLPNHECSLRHNYSVKEIERQGELFSKKLLGKPVPLPQVECSVSTGNMEASSSNHLLSTMQAIQSVYSHNQIIRSDNSRIDATTESENFNNSLKISPIDPRNVGEFKSSTPSTKYRQEIKSAVNLTNMLLSPKKSTMSTEELNVIIHKGKKRLNVKSTDNISKILPTPISNKSLERSTKSVEVGYLGNKPRSRFSWSPSDGEYVEYNTNVDKLSPAPQTESKQSRACTDRKTNSQISRLDFKKLLLRQNIKTSIIPSSNTRLSAVEQLKLSKQVTSNNRTRPEMDIIQLSKSPKKNYNRKVAKNNDIDGKQRPMPKLMSPKSQWKFVNPRSDVLSSTILEDCGEIENSSSLINQDSILKTGKLDFHFKDEDDFSPIVRNFDSKSTRKPVLQQNDSSITLIAENFTYKSVSAIPISQLTTSQKGKFSDSSQFSSGVHDYDSHHANNIIESTTSSSLPTLETAF